MLDDSFEFNEFSMILHMRPPSPRASWCVCDDVQTRAGDEEAGGAGQTDGEAATVGAREGRAETQGNGTKGGLFIEILLLHCFRRIRRNIIPIYSI